MRLRLISMMLTLSALSSVGMGIGMKRCWGWCGNGDETSTLYHGLAEHGYTMPA